MVTTSTRPGPGESDTVCTPIEPLVSVRDGGTTDDVRTATVPAQSIVAVTPEDVEPVATETPSLGAPVVTTEVRGTGRTCSQNPSNAEQRRNAC